MSPHQHITNDREIGFPRVSGDEPFATAIAREMIAFSPRERG